MSLHENLILTDNKNIIDGTVLIDDRVTNAQSFKKESSKRITATLEYPWSTNKDYDIISKSWSKLAEAILKRF